MASAALLLAGACASGRPEPVAPDPASVPVPAVPPADRAPPAGARTDTATAPDALPFQAGVASWYGPGFDGRRTASGEIFRADSLTAAHPTLPFGTVVRVVRIDSGHEVVVRINDRGPFAGGRVIDLSRAAAERLEMIRAGLADVRIYIVREREPGAPPP